jgi:polysaccharide pyruvyl transferase WcaK-like protein
MDALILGYYSSIEKGDLCMLRGLFYFSPGIKKVYLPVLYPYVENLIIEKEGLKEDVEIFHFFNLPKLFQLIFKTRKVLFLLGDVLTGSYGTLSNIFAMVNLFLLFLIGRRAIILSSSILPSKLPKSFLKFFIRRAGEVYIRERGKLKEMKEINERVFVMKDLSIFYLNSKRLKNRKKNIIVLTIRNSTPEIMKINRKKFVNVIAEQLTFFLEKHPNYKVLLLPFQMGIRRKSDDRRILREIYNSMEEHKGKIIFLGKFLNLDKTIGIIKESRLLISSKLHPCIFAYILKTPFIALGESFKICYFAKKNKGTLIRKKELTNLNKYIAKILNS